MDFSKKLSKTTQKKELDPLEIFKLLDKQAGDEYLRDPQKYVLQDWHKHHRLRRDNVVKLHTGEGKTLTGLLMLQSYMLEDHGPAIYVCPNNYLVDQTIAEAERFGIKTVDAGKQGLSMEFRNSKAILVANCHKVFNGFSQFGVTGSSFEAIQIGAFAMDDAHRCIDIIREAFSVNVKRKIRGGGDNQIYNDLFSLFRESLRSQAQGTLKDIEAGEDSIMAVPFWTWHDRQDEVLNILEEHKAEEEVKYAWNLLKDRLSQSVCTFSGNGVQISPRTLPIEMIPSFHKAKRRIFLSATLMEDAFLVRDLGVSQDSVNNPLSGREAKYSGERMILMPALVDPKLDRDKIIPWLTRLANKNGHFGVVVLVPSFKISKKWVNAGAISTSKDNLIQKVSELKQNVKKKIAKEVVVLVNQYDGIDLPDASCRVLCLDSLPDYNSLIEDYHKEARPESTLMRRKLAQRIEQGLGRGIRGPSDWCIVVITGYGLTDFLSEDPKRMFLSKEAQSQIAISEDLIEQLKEEGGGLKALEGLMNQSLNRDPDWKAFYHQTMNEIETDVPNKEYLKRAVMEREAEILIQQGQQRKAQEIIQQLIEQADPGDRGWYLQLMATYIDPIDRNESMELQLKAHSENNSLFKPDTGVTYTKMVEAGSKRESLILQWIIERQTHNSMIVHLKGILENVSFGARATLFEDGVKELGRALGFDSQRPERETKNGPDNLWRIKGKSYWIISCKNEVDPSKTEISKKEASQMLSDKAWFNNAYEGNDGKSVIIHPGSKLAKDANIDGQVWAITHEKLKKLKSNVLSFYNSFQTVPRDRITVDIIKRKLADAHLEIEDLNDYIIQVRKSLH